MKKLLTVSMDGQNWKLQIEGSSKIIARYKTQKEAINAAIKLAKQYNLEVVVQRKDGTFGLKNSYGNDPVNIWG